jgi:6-phosphogluconolactonase (cycloisomerase 2 family)
MPDFNDGVWQFAIDTMSGEPNLLPNGYVTSVCDSPGPVTIDPSGRFAYVIATLPASSAQRAGIGALFGFTIDPMTGALTAIPGSPFAFALPGIVSGQFSSVAIDPAGRFAYALDPGNSLVWAFNIDPESGGLSAVPGSPFATPAGNTALAIEPHGKFAYATEMSGTQSSSLTVFSIDRVSGALGPAPGIASLALPYVTPPQIDPSGRFAYLTAGVGTTSTGVYAYTISANTGALALVAGAPFATATCSPTGGCPTLVTVTN